MKLPTIRRTKKDNKLTQLPVFASDIRQSINTSPVTSNPPEKPHKSILKSTKQNFKKNNQTFTSTHPYLQDKKQQRKKLRFIKNIRLNLKNKVVFFSTILIFISFLIVVIFGLTNSHILKDTFLANPQADPRKIEIIEKILTENNIKFEALEYKENHFEFNLKDGVKVLMSENKVGEDVSTLQLIAERFKIEGRRLTLIDLRFDKPVIR